MKKENEHRPASGNDGIEPTLYPVLTIAAVAVLYIAAVPAIPLASAFGNAGVIAWTATVLGLAAGGTWWISRASDPDAGSAGARDDGSSQKSDQRAENSPERRT